MKTVNFFKTLFIATAIVGALSLSSCNDDDDPKTDDPDIENPEDGDTDVDEEQVVIDIDGNTLISENTTWKANSIVNWAGHIVINPGVTLTIEEGVTVLADKSVGPELYIEGSLIAIGTADKPIKFTVPEADRTENNILKLAAWGGFICSSTAENFVMDHCVMEFCNATLTDEYPSIQRGEVKLDEGDPSYGFYSENPNTKVIVHNSVIAYTIDDAFRPEGGQLSFYNNVFAFIGSTGGEALNIKKGTTGDIAYNLFYNCATNGPKWSSKNAGEVQTNMNVYNNTILNGGYRRSSLGRGGSINIEESARGTIKNNLIVNCRYGFRVVDESVDMANTAYGYQYYFGNDAIMVSEFVPSNGILTEAAATSITDNNDPMFANYDVNSFKVTWDTVDDEGTSVNVPVSTTETLKFEQWTNFDFHLKSGSPALSVGQDGISATYNHNVAGKTFSVPPSKNYIGAFGTN